MADAAEQRRAIDEVDSAAPVGFRLLQGVEANIGADGQLDLSPSEAALFDVVLAAPHPRLRRAEDQTGAMVAAVEHRRSGSSPTRAVAWRDPAPASSLTGTSCSRRRPRKAWPSRSTATRRGRTSITVWRDGRYAPAAFALDSDAHAPAQLVYAETALAHARLAGIPSERIVNCWPLDRLRSWLADRGGNGLPRHPPAVAR